MELPRNVFVGGLRRYLPLGGWPLKGLKRGLEVQQFPDLSLGGSTSHLFSPHSAFTIFEAIFADGILDCNCYLIFHPDLRWRML